MRAIRRNLSNAFQIFWRGLRQWCGDSAYETYLDSANRQPGRKPLAPAEFYVEQLNRKYSRPNRCC
jgi:uncharacterized short protein YbdD (DUF466 family)